MDLKVQEVKQVLLVQMDDLGRMDKEENQALLEEMVLLVKEDSQEAQDLKELLV